MSEERGPFAINGDMAIELPGLSGVMEQWPDGSWHLSVPEPLWVGYRLRTAQCECGERFKHVDARDRYQEHWRARHSTGVFE